MKQEDKDQEEVMLSKAEVKGPGFSFKIEDLGWKELVALAMILIFLAYVLS